MDLINFSTFSSNMVAISDLPFIKILSLLLFFFFLLAIRGLFIKHFIKRLSKIVQQSSSINDDIIFETLKTPLKFLPFLVTFFVFNILFQLNSKLEVYIGNLNQSLFSIFIFWLLYSLVDPLEKVFSKGSQILSKALFHWIVQATKYLFIFLGVVAVLEIWGVRIGPIIAGLGLFGVAVALGAQDLFKNLISGIMILTERRIQIGDYINVPGHCDGTVEHIGFRSTIIRKFDTTPITIPNFFFAETPILNFSKRHHRRINWTIGLEYKTSKEQLDTILLDIKKYLNKAESFLNNDSYKQHVYIDKFNDSSIDIFIYCYTLTVDWQEFLNIKEKLAFEIKKIVESNGSSFAFPSRTIYHENLDKNVT